MESKIEKIAIIDHTESLDGRVDLLKHYFEDKGLQTDVIMSDFSHYKKKIIDNKKNGYIYLHTIPYKKNISLKRIFSHIYFAKKVYNFLCRENYDLVWVLLPPNYLLKEIVRAKKKKHFLLIGDIEDLWPESLPIKSNLIKKTLFFNYWMNLRNKNLKYADYVVTECDAYMPYLRKYISSARHSTLPLAKKRTEEVGKSAKVNKSILRVAYVGSINNIINIELIIQVIRKLTAFKNVEVIIIGDGESREKLIEKLSCLNSVRVKYLGKIFDERNKQLVLRNCNFGINIMKDSVVVGFTMKSLDYLKNGLFLLNNIQDDTWKLVENEQLGINVSKNIILDEAIINKSYSLKEKNRIIQLYNNKFSTGAFNNKLDSIFEALDKE